MPRLLATALCAALIMAAPGLGAYRAAAAATPADVGTPLSGLRAGALPDAGHRLAPAPLPPGLTLGAPLSRLPDALPRLSPAIAAAVPSLPAAAAPAPTAVAAPAADVTQAASPLAGLRANAPLAGAAAAQKGLSAARESSGANFYQAARLESAPDESAVWAGPAALKASPSEQKVLDKVAQDLGPVIAPEQAPGLHAALGALFGRLSAAQQKLFPADAVSINRVHVVDTPLLNAFVYPLKTPGVRRSSNMVFVTTGLLKKMLGEGPAGLSAGLVRVAGVLAHELAHPLDNVDAEGVLANHGREAGSQAREVRADSEGAMIAKEAGYPVESVYESLRLLFADEAGGGLADSLASTHPQNDLRLAMQRMLLTLDRYEKGTRAPSYPEAAQPAILPELAALEQGAASGRFSAPRDLAEALRRLKALSELQDRDAYKQLEFNRLVLSVDALLARKGELDDEDFRLFTEYNRALAKPGPELLDREGMNRAFTAQSRSEEFRSYPPHEAFMKKIPAYNSPRYLDWARANFFTKSDGYGTVQRSVRALARILPSEPLFSVFGDRIAAGLPVEMLSHPNSRYIYEQSVAKGLSAESQVRLAVLFHEKVLPRLSEEERLAFFLASSSDHYSYVFPQTRDDTEKGYSLGLLRQRALLMGDPRLKPLQEQYRAALRSIWDRRGYYGTLDLIVSFNKTDWDTVFSALDIDPQAGRAQLRQAVKQFSTTPAFAALAKTAWESNFDAFRLLKLGRPMGKLGGNDWLDGTMGTHLAGDFNAALRADPALGRLARQLFAGAYYQARPEAFLRAYRRGLAAALAKAGGGLDRAGLEAVHRDLLERLAGGSQLSARLAAAQAEALDRSPVPAADKKALLQAVFLDGANEAQQVHGLTFARPASWLTSGDESASTVMGALLKNGLAPDTLGLFAQLLAREDFREFAKKEGFSGYAAAVSAFKAPLLGDLDRELSGAADDAGKAQALQRFLETVVDPADGDYATAGLVNTPELREMKSRAAALASGLDVPFTTRLALFRRLTGSGATPATDAFFVQRLEPDFDAAAAAAAGLPLPAILESGRIAGSNLQLALTRGLLEPEIERLAAAPPDPEALNRLVETINAYVRQGSLQKDDYLESLAWRLGLSGRELGAFIEDEKSYNWRKADPLLLRFGSALSAEISKLSPQSRTDFIAFLIQPEGRELPSAILKELQRHAYLAALAADAAQEYHAPRDKLKKDADRAAYLMKLEIESALIDASPFERIPLFELLLSAGPQALRNAADFPDDVTRPFLRYEAGSTEKKMLDAYLAVAPAHERTVSLAYLLSQAGRDKSSVKNIFEVFQTVGVKFGQLSSTWKLFGEEVARETASLKNDARPMTRAEILEAMQRTLTPEELSRVKTVKKVIGSASLKTVALVELQDGREAVMLLRRPHAAEQIETNLRLGQAFLRELDRRGLSRASAMLDAVLDAVRSQLAEELKFTREAEQLRAARRRFAGLNASMGARLGGWRFEVPGLVEGFQVRDSLLFLEKAEGTTYDKLSPEDRAAAGPLIAESALSLLFREGWFDADRHTGNQLIDARRKIIYPFDFGQATDFSRGAFWRGDDRYELAQFLRAFDAGDAQALLRHGRAMSAPAGQEVDAALRADVVRILAGEDSMPDRLIALVSAFAARGPRLDGRFTFGAFKGLMTLYSEGYVGDAGFRALLSREIASLLRRKWPRTLADARRRGPSPPSRS